MLSVSYIFAYPVLLSIFMLQGSSWVLPLSFSVSIFFLKGFFLSSESGFGAHYQSLFSDSIGIIFCILSILVVLVSAAATMSRRKSSVMVNFYVSLITLLFLFSTNNLMSYFLLFELSLVPLYFLIAFWSGQYERVLSNYYFILFSVLTSVPLFLIVCELFNESCLEYSSLSLLLPSGYQVTSLWIMFSVLLAFMAKLPVYGLHSWLPKAHVDAPVSGSMVLASMLLKLSGYSVIRLILGFSSNVSLLLIFSIWGYLVTAVMCMRLVDYKVVVAYSSVSHMSIAFSSLVSYIMWGFTGAFLMMISHSVVSPLMFYISNLWYERVSTRSIGNMKSSKMWFSISALFLLTFMFNISFPPFMNFFAEVSLFYSITSAYSVCAFLAFLSFCFSSICWLNIFVMMFHSKKMEGVSNYLTLSELSLSSVLVLFFLLFSASLSML